MKRHVIYECGKCGNKSEMYNEIATCEAKHIGLTLKETAKYIDMQEKVKTYSYTVSISNNEETRSNLDKAIEELIEFEEKYNIK